MLRWTPGRAVSSVGPENTRETELSPVPGQPSTAVRVDRKGGTHLDKQ